MRKCPFCKAEVKYVYPYLMFMEDLNRWGLFHHCNEKCGVIISAETKDLEVTLEDLLHEARELPGIIKAEILAG